MTIEDQLKSALAIADWRDRLLALSEIEDLDPMNPEVQLELGKCFLRLGDFTSAGRALKRSQRIDDDGWASLYLGNLYFHQEELDAAEEHFLAAQQRLPELATPIWCRADISKVRGNDELAEELYRAAVKLDPADAPALAHLGRHLISFGQREAGEAHTLQALELDPECDYALRTRKKFDF